MDSTVLQDDYVGRSIGVLDIVGLTTKPRKDGQGKVVAKANAPSDASPRLRPHGLPAQNMRQRRANARKWKVRDKPMTSEISQLKGLSCPARPIGRNARHHCARIARQCVGN